MASALAWKFELVTLCYVRLSNNFESTLLALELFLQLARVDIAGSHHSSENDDEFTDLLSLNVPYVSTHHVLHGWHINEPYVDVLLN